MIKIAFFSEDIIIKYENEIAETVKNRNDNNNNILIIPSNFKNPKTGQPYEISIHDLITLDRKQISIIDGIKLYMCVCYVQKYKNMSNVELLHSLHLEYPKNVKEIEYRHRRYIYCINKENYTIESKNDKSSHGIILEAAKIIKSEIEKYDTKYANHYFNSKTIDNVYELKRILVSMYNDLKTCIENNDNELIIDYSIVSGDLRHKLMNDIGIRTCPYCNRNYITRYGINGSKSTADLDHFYQKAQYPLFALSLFNFVPSCPVCNSRMKNTHPADDSLYPYEEGFEKDVHFELKYTEKKQKAIDILHLWQALSSVNYDDYELDIVINNDVDIGKRKRIEKSKELFHLKEVYEDHKQDAMEIAFRTRIYCEGSYQSFCEKLFDKLKGKMMFPTASDLKEYMFRKGFDDEWLMFGTSMHDPKRMYDKPLSVMIHDIYNSSKYI